MVWNHSVYNGHSRNLWEDRDNGNDSDGNNNKNKRKQKFLDLDNIFHKINRRFIKSNNRSSNIPSSKNSFYIIIMLLVLLITWVGSGFYTIKEAERGVILRFGKFNHIVQPGLNWRPIFIDTVNTVNVESVRELATSGIMLTSDENLVRVEMNVQYRITNPEHYLFSVTNADDSLCQATDSALRGVIGKYTMDRILTEGRTVVRTDTQHVLEETIYPYNMGIALLDINFQAARPPEEVKAAFDDAIAAQENEQQYIREAEAYSNEVQPRANGQAQRILEEGRAYKTRTILEAQGEIQRFSKILMEYKEAPEITRERLYIDSMERILNNINKILISNKTSNNVIILPLDKILLNSTTSLSKDNNTSSNNKASSPLYLSTNKSTAKNTIVSPINNDNVDNNNKTIIDQRRANIHRDDILREGRN